MTAYLRKFTKNVYETFLMALTRPEAEEEIICTSKNNNFFSKLEPYYIDEKKFPQYKTLFFLLSSHRTV